MTKIVFAKGALPDDADQELVDAITAAMQAMIDGGELPEGVEMTPVTGPIEFDEDEIAQALEQNSHLPAADLARLEEAMRNGDTETFVEILTSAHESDSTH